MIFLSASVPKMGREFFGKGNVPAIREAVMAFTKVCMDLQIPFYFGGHPAITPLVYRVAKEYGGDFVQNIAIYQSEIFKGKTPKDLVYYPNIKWTPVHGNISESVTFMRQRMFEENANTKCAVFIGGMNGILDEAKKIKVFFPSVDIIPVASTGAASVQLYKDMGIVNIELLYSYAYVSIFTKLLSKYK